MQNIYIPYMRTQDFEKSLILRSAGAILFQVEWDGEKRRAEFIFENISLCNKILDNHKRGKLKLNSNDVLMAYREVKNELFAKK